MTTQSDPITGAQLNQIEQQTASIPGLAQPTLSGKQFVFFAAFDGTNNDLHNVPNGETGTNVGELWRQYNARDSLQNPAQLLSP